MGLPIEQLDCSPPCGDGDQAAEQGFKLLKGRENLLVARDRIELSTRAFSVCRVIRSWLVNQLLTGTLVASCA